MWRSQEAHASEPDPLRPYVNHGKRFYILQSHPWPWVNIDSTYKSAQCSYIFNPACFDTFVKLKLKLSLHEPG